MTEKQIYALALPNGDVPSSESLDAMIEESKLHPGSQLLIDMGPRPYEPHVRDLYYYNPETGEATEPPLEFKSCSRPD